MWGSLGKGGYAVGRMRALALLLLTLALAACSGGEHGRGDSNAPQANDMTNGPPSLKRAHANLSHTPAGGVTLTWRPDDQILRIALDLYGFAPNSTHPAQVRRGRCASGDPVQYDLGALVADGEGRISKTLTQPGVRDGMPSHGWYLEIQNAVGGDPYQQIALGCMNIDDADAGASRQQAIQATVSAGAGLGMNVAGEATLEVEGGQLVVVATLQGLEPYSVHPLLITRGACAHLGATVITFYPAQADSNGRAKIKQTFDGIAQVATGWSLVVLRGVHLQSQVDAAPISCGDIKALGR